MTQVKCPYCKKMTLYSPANPYRPFCSERCKMIDLGNWADEAYNVPSAEDESFNVNEISEEEQEGSQAPFKSSFQ